MNAIENAVAPLKTNAIEQARDRALRYAESLIAELEAAEGKFDIAFPFPSSMNSRANYVNQKAKRDRAASVTKTIVEGQKWRKIDRISERSEEGIQRMVAEFEAAAAASYDAYVAKLNAKIGAEVTAAELIGDRLWNYSILQITRADGNVQRWKTQMILNVSCLGKLFNQWPTRACK